MQAVAVFGSVSTGTWHELSDVDLDIVTGDDVAVVPGREIEALFGPRAAIVVTGADCADVVLDSLEEASIRWHPRAGGPAVVQQVAPGAGAGRERAGPDLGSVWGSGLCGWEEAKMRYEA